MNCGCELPPEHLCGYCDDDLFCPQCGSRVSELASTNEPPRESVVEDEKVPSRLWTYAVLPRDDGVPGFRAECRLTFRFRTSDRTRGSVPRRLELDLERSRVEAPHPFGRRLEVVREEDEESVYRVQVIDAVVDEHGDEWQGEIRSGGVEGRIVLVGSCGRIECPLKIYPEPDLEIEIDGPGVIAEKEGGHSLGNDGRQSISVSMRPRNCDLVVGDGVQRQLTVVDQAFADLEENPMPIGTIGPNRPGSLRFSFDATGWEEGAAHQLLLAPDWKVLPERALVLPLTFRRQAQGQLVFGAGEDRWELPPIHVGERGETRSGGDCVLDPKLFQNRGQSLMTLRRPETRPAGLDWLAIDWERWDPAKEQFVPVVGGNELALDVDELGRLHLTIDFSKEPVRHTGEPLSIDFFVEEQQRTISLPLLLAAPTPRPELEGALAVDFGNSNTFVAYADGERYDDEGEPTLVVAPVPLGAPDPEWNPTALFFRDAANPRDVLIGTEAVKFGNATPSAFFDGLKRPLVAPETLARKVRILDKAGARNEEIDRRELILLYLEQLLKTCERKLRKRVLRVCFSHPANHHPRSRAAMNEIIAELERRWRGLHPGDTVEFERLAVDEASAVCLQFSLDPDAYKREILPRLPDDSERRFLVATIDVGGGSTDLCLAEFIEKYSDSQIYESRLFGIGGDETLGGDAFTVATFEILAEKLQEIAKGAKREFKLGLVDEPRPLGDPVPWTNTRALWTLAEEIKKLAFSSRWDSEKAKTAAEAFLSTALTASAVGPAVTRAWAADADLRTKFDAAFATPEAWPTADQIYERQIKHDLQGGRGYTLKRRLDRCLDKLTRYLKRAERERSGAAVDFVVIAGAGSRAPLVKELAKQRFDKAIFVDEGSGSSVGPKARVAAGLARYYELRRASPAMVEELSVSSRYTHADLVWTNPTGPDIVLVESCTKLDDPGSTSVSPGRPLKFLVRDPVSRRLYVSREATPKNVDVGYFDLSAAATDGKRLEERHMTDPRPRLLVRVGASEDRLHLSVVFDDIDLEFGEWPLVPIVP